MRKALKFLHTMAAVGYIGAFAALLVLHVLLPEPADLERFAALRVAQGTVARWLILPSMALVVISGLISMAWTTAYLNAGWVWAKAATGILIFEGTLVYVQGPMRRAAENAEAALAGEIEIAALGADLGPEWGSFWVLLLVGIANVALGVWRPRFGPNR